MMTKVNKSLYVLSLIHIFILTAAVIAFMTAGSYIFVQMCVNRQENKRKTRKSEIAFRPVSYTHLDVYKRQDQGYRGVVIQLFRQLNDIQCEGNVIRAQAGALLSAVANMSLIHI